MNYSEIFICFLILIMFIRSSLHIIITTKIKGKDICVTVNLKYFFNIINIHRQLYPPTNKKSNNKSANKKESKKGKKKNTLLASDILSICRLIKKIKIVEVYSNIEFGCTYMHITNFVYVLVNIIYGNLINYINPDKMYLNISPNFLKDYVDLDIKIHIKPSIRDIGKVIIAVYKVYRKNKSKVKGGAKNEGDRVNSKSYGNNS